MSSLATNLAVYANLLLLSIATATVWGCLHDKVKVKHAHDFVLDTSGQFCAGLKQF